MLVKVAYYAGSIAFFSEIMLKLYVLFFSNHAPFTKIILFEKIANKSKK